MTTPIGCHPCTLSQAVELGATCVNVKRSVPCRKNDRQAINEFLGEPDLDKLYDTRGFGTKFVLSDAVLAMRKAPDFGRRGFTPEAETAHRMIGELDAANAMREAIAADGTCMAPRMRDAYRAALEALRSELHVPTFRNSYGGTSVDWSKAPPRLLNA